MTIRTWKAIFVAIFALMALGYALNNVANLSGAMYASFAYVLGQADHAAYPESIVPAITHPALIWTTLLTVLVLEFACAALAGYGAWQMWQARHGNPSEFAAAKKHALNGLGLGVIVWFLLFGVFGAAVFQMWQTQVGQSSYEGAFQFTVYALLLFGLVAMDESR